MDDKVVIRYIDGKTIKGYMANFSEKSDNISIREIDSDKAIQVSVDSMKAIFFVRSFEGKRSYNEKKVYGISAKKGSRAFVKFKDAESLVGFLSGDVPWDKKKGFYNIKKPTNNEFMMV